jgi:mycofactocin precursor
VSEPQVLEATELELKTTPAPTELETGPMLLPPADEVLDDDLLVEEISIDGMCGVY